ncbi:MAG: hypothetical protein K6A30_05640 [Lachnospiraceae bacterium]|nr:hypothetical protein [Lachnospiraceae bacterium]
MNRLIEIKTSILNFIEKNEPYVLAGTKFIMMLMAYLMVYFNIGYLSKIHIIFVPIVLAMISAVIPMGFGAFILSLYVLGNLYGLGIEVTAVAASLFLLAYLIYFRFAPKKSYIMVLTPILWVLKIPYIASVAVGLTGTVGTGLAVLIGTVIFYFLKGVKTNEALFLNAGEYDSVSKLSVALQQSIGNSEMWIVLAAFALTIIVVYTIRRKSIDNAWRTAIYVGSVLQGIVILMGKLLTGSAAGSIGIIVGSLIAVGLGIVLEFMLFHLDYSRVENVQFEDDYYYYYVKAVPKVTVRAKEKKVTTYGAEKTDKKDRMEKKEKEAEQKEEELKEQIAKELDIDPDILK